MEGTVAEGQTRRVSRKVWDRGLAWSSLPGVLSSAGEAPSQQLSACWGGGLAATFFGEQMVFGEGTKPVLGSYFLLAVWCDLIYAAAFLLGIAN